jgi:DNA-binding NtrC family response regulator
VLATPAPTDRVGVLIVDESEDAREVLRTALERRGVATLAAAEAHAGVQLAQQHRPQLIVLDLESIPPDEPDLSQQYDTVSRSLDTELVVLGRAQGFAPPLPRDRIVPKPYHFAPLVRTIERILGAWGQRDGVAVRDSGPGPG